MIIWNVGETQERRPYERPGVHDAHIQGSHVLIEGLQASLIFKTDNNSMSKSCGIKNLKIMDDDFIIEVNLTKNDDVNSKRKRDDNLGNAENLRQPFPIEENPEQNGDPENPKLQFLFDTAQRQLAIR